MDELPRRLRALRTKDLDGETVEGLARRLAALGVKKVSGSSVSRYERGERPIPADYVAAMARLTGRSLAEIMWGNEPTEDDKRLRAYMDVRAIVVQTEGLTLIDEAPPIPEPAKGQEPPGPGEDESGVA